MTSIDRVQKVSQLMADYMNTHGGPVDINKAISYVRSHGVPGSDEDLRNLIRQCNVVEKNPIRESMIDIMVDIELAENNIQPDSTLAKVLRLFLDGTLSDMVRSEDQRNSLVSMLIGYGLIDTRGSVTYIGKKLLDGTPVRANLSRFKFHSDVPVNGSGKAEYN